MTTDRKRIRAQAKPGREWFRIENKADNEAEVWIYDEIGYWGVTAADFVGQLRDIDASKITLHLNSPGGDVFDGIAIYNALKDHDAEVTVIVDALAASAASFIAMAGDKIIMNRNSEMMIHDAMGVCIGQAVDMSAMAELLDRTSDNIATIYAARGGTTREWRDRMRAESWYSATEAVEAGLADEARDAADEDAEKIAASWDLTIFNHTGRTDAPDPADPPEVDEIAPAVSDVAIDTEVLRAALAAEFVEEPSPPIDLETFRAALDLAVLDAPAPPEPKATAKTPEPASVGTAIKEAMT